MMEIHKIVNSKRPTMKNQITIYILLIVSVLTFSNCELEDPVIGVTTDEIISIKSSEPEILANGEARIILTAELLDKSDPNRSITFQTEAGSFPLSGEGAQIATLTASGRIAEITLQSDYENTGSVIISATVGNYSKPLVLDFKPAFPNDIVSAADRQTITADRVEFAQITTKLYSDVGFPTIGTRVNYEIIELDTATASIVPFDFADVDLQSVVNVKSDNGKPGVVQVVISTEGEAENQVIEIVFEE
ncbi:MAG: hypothetical protein ACI85O_003070 [Saprospiraceae bacterium]|jgi:hypothetical protein